MSKQEKLYRIPEGVAKLGIGVVGWRRKEPDNSRSSCIFTLSEDGSADTRQFKITVGPDLARDIVLELEHIQYPLPLTHDMCKEIVVALSGVLSEVHISYMVAAGCYRATLVFFKLEKPDEEILIGARASDGILLALKCGAPLYVEESIFDEE